MESLRISSSRKSVNNKPARHKASSFRGEFQRFYNRLHDSERKDTNAIIRGPDCHGISDVNVIEEAASNEIETVTKPVSLRQNVPIYRSVSASVKPQNRHRSRLVPSKSAVSFKEMRRIVRKCDPSHQRHHSEAQVRPQDLQSNSRDRSQEMRLDFNSQFESGCQAQAKNEANHLNLSSFQDLLVEIPQDDAVSERSFSSDNSSSEGNINQVIPPATDVTSESEEEVDEKVAEKSQTIVNSYPLCKECGQKHRVSENHEYEYTQEIDEDFLCDVCLQPFVEPYDTKCGHTFCCVCLKNYVRLKNACPVDRTKMNFVPSDCWQSSLVLRRLVDKMVVMCPNRNHCQISIARSNLSAHLKERCPGTNTRCRYAMFGCSFKGPRVEENEHITNCKFKGYEGNPIEIMYPNHEKHIVEQFRPDGNAELGLRIVGGNDTPLSNIIVQSVQAGSLLHSDGRIQPGDIIIEVNGEDFHSISHVEARAVLCKNSRLIRFSLLREKRVEPDDDFMMDAERFTQKIIVSIIKPPSEQLGIKLASYESGAAGVYVEDILPGKVAHASGLLRIGDRILKIANVDLANGNSEIAAHVIQGAGEKFDMIVSRRLSEILTTIANPWACQDTSPRSPIKATVPTKPTCPTSPPIPQPEVIPMIMSHKKKVISITKDVTESLGIIVAGGMNGCEGNLPIFVQDIQPMGMLGRDNRIKLGDLLLEINGIPLTGLTNGQAVSTLKSVTGNCEHITLIVVELFYSGKEEDFALVEELSGVHHQRADHGMERNIWKPSWKLWLAVPAEYRIPHNVTIRRNSWGEFGLCVVGGKSESDDSVDLPLLIKHVSTRSPAAIYGRLRCGDEILAVNGRSVTGMTHSQVVETLKQSTSSVKLTIMSWPGSSH